MAIGIRTAFITTQDAVFNADTVLRSIGLVTPIKSNQTLHIRAGIFGNNFPGGIQLQVQGPAFINYFQSIIYEITSIVKIYSASITNSLVFSNTGGAPPNRILQVDIHITNGANDGIVDIQIAQNAAVGTLTILTGSEMEVTNFGSI